MRHQVNLELVGVETVLGLFVLLHILLKVIAHPPWHFVPFYPNLLVQIYFAETRVVRELLPQSVDFLESGFAEVDGFVLA